MKILLLTAVIAFPAAAQPVPPGNIQLTADQHETSGASVHLSGHVNIKSAALHLTADAVDFNQETSTITARGNVIVGFPRGNFDIMSRDMDRDDALVHLFHHSGHVTVDAVAWLLRADRVDRDIDASEFLSDTDVIVQLK